MCSVYDSSRMVISWTCTTEYETESDDGLSVKGDVEVEGSTGVGVICFFFFAIGPPEVTVTSYGMTSVTSTMGTTKGGGTGGIWVKAFTEVMRGGAGNTLVTGWSQEDDKPDSNTSMESATRVPSIATSSCCIASVCSWSASWWTYCARWILLNACRKEYSLKQNRFW